MVNFMSELPIWQAEGVRPPDNVLIDGWKASQKPPADYFNWFFSRTHFALKELQEKSATEENLDLHKARTDNPHKVTAAQVGLSNVINQKQATKVEFDTHDADQTRHITESERTSWNSKAAGVHNHSWGDIQNVPIGSLTQLGVIRLVDSVASTDRTKAATPNSVKDAYDRGTQGIADAAEVQKNLDAHGQNRNNPHAVTASQIGLGKVANYDIATTEEAVAGTSNSKYVTPFTVSEAIKALQAIKSVNGKTGTVILGKSDVGLGNVDNVKQASKSEFDTHANDSDKHITANERSDWNSKANGSHTHTMSQVDGLTASLNSKTNSRGYSNGTVTSLGEEFDINTLNETGTFMGYKMVGAPDSGWWYIDNMVHNSGYCTQVAYRLNNSTDFRPKIRSKVNGKWFEWQTLSVTTDNAPTATKLKTPILINDVFFDGSKNIDVLANPKNTILSRGTDLDTVITDGMYNTHTNTDTSTLKNCPFATTCVLFVVSACDGQRINQTIQQLSTGKMCVRCKIDDGAWSDWKNVAFMEEVETQFSSHTTAYFAAGKDNADVTTGFKYPVGEIIATDKNHSISDLAFTVSEDKTTLTVNRDVILNIHATVKMHGNNSTDYAYCRIENGSNSIPFAMQGSTLNGAINFNNTFGSEVTIDVKKGGTISFVLETRTNKTIFRTQMVSLTIKEVKGI